MTSVLPAAASSKILVCSAIIFSFSTKAVLASFNATSNSSKSFCACINCPLIVEDSPIKRKSSLSACKSFTLLATSSYSFVASAKFFVSSSLLSKESSRACVAASTAALIFFCLITSFRLSAMSR